MKSIKKKQHTRYAVLPMLAAIMLVPAAAQASVLLYDTFDTGAGGYTAGALAGQSPAVTGFDAAAWGGGAGTRTVEAASLSFSSIADVGGSVRQTSSVAGAAGPATISRGMDVSVATGAVYLSYLFSPTAGGARINSGLVIGGNEFAFYKNVPGSDTDTDTTMYYGGAQTQYAGTIAAGQNYLVLAKLDGLGTGSGGTIDLWAMTETEYAAVLLAGVSEANLNALVAFQMSDTLAGAAPTFTGSETLGVYVRDTGGSAGVDSSYDEIMIATTLDEAMHVPTPAALPAGLAILGLAAMRRRRFV